MTKQLLKTSLAIGLAAILTACASSNHTSSIEPTNVALKTALASQEQATQDRYSSRNPEQTLNFFGIEPGMTVVEALPGGGWYSKILLPYLGEGGELIGADYSCLLYTSPSPRD